MKTHPLLTRSRATALVTALALAFGPGGLLPGFTVGAVSAAPVKKGGATVTLNFVNAEIEGVARAMAVIVDKQIMVDPRVKGAITLYSDQPLTPREAYLNFLAALRGQGFSVVEVGNMLKIVPEAEAKLQTGTVEVGTVKRAGDQVLTQIFRLQFESAANMVGVLRPLISPNNTINANPGSNTLVVTDYADNLQRISQMIAAMDVPSTTDMEAIPLQHAIAVDIAPMVQKLIDGGAAPGAAGGATAGGAVVMADARTNTLMVRAQNAARMGLVRNVIQRLDRPGTAGVGGSGIHVVYLRNADAVKLAQVLRAAFASAGGSSSSGGGASGGSPTSATSTPTTQTGMNTSSGSNSGGASSQATAPVGASVQPSTGGFIQADPSSNSLIITASDALYKQLRAVIEQLDGRRAQIYIEAMIVEVSEQKLAEVGFQWAAGSGNSTQVIGGTNLAQGGTPGLFSLIADPETVGAGLTGLNVGIARRLSSGKYSLGALASFLETNADGNVLSKPNMIALDNEEAKIVVGQNVPFVTGSYTNNNSSSGSVNPFTTVERKDVGLTLRVRPQVGEGGTVRMTVFQENSSVDASSRTNAQGLTTNKSSIETTVVIDNGTTLVLGGLLKDEFSNGNSQVPLLGDIPVLGNLFKSRSRSRNKTNLMVFLRPVVIRDQDASNAITLDRYEFMRQKQISSQPEESAAMRKINGAPLIEPWKLSNDMAPPSVRQPLDDPNAAEPNLVLPRVQPVPAPAAVPAASVPVAPAAPTTSAPR
ncbi:type II secretion system secretin GspD [Aquabacterium parvum]|uniref:type II secretion system secretin GspD n=1 Tax=Aquabacterium parvum TaxID=70584 RepID=UPI0009F8C388|nr:type II secretion system secretin GspD [Aquabacterium parvum]MBU0914866.1 type II secretion system secretin GspD [Gammaproteobacteria bacterium]